MSKETDIQAWFDNGQRFRAGVYLLQSFGHPLPDKLLQNAHNDLPDAYLRDLLKSQMIAALNITMNYELSTMPTVHSSQPTVHSSQFDTVHSLKLIDDIRHRRRRLYDHMKQLHGEMREAALNGRETYDRPAQILDIWAEIHEVSEIIHAYEKDGTLPPPPENAVQLAIKDTIAKMKRIEYLNQKNSRPKTTEADKKKNSIEIDSLKQELGL